MEQDRVRRHSPERVVVQIDQASEDRILAHAARGEAEITRRIGELDREWDVERVLQANAGALALTGAVLGLTVNKRWLAVPGVVFSFFLQHAVQGWCPPIPVFRRAGVRTRQEIDREKYALKALRGDFAELAPKDRPEGS